MEVGDEEEQKDQVFTKREDVPMGWFIASWHDYSDGSGVDLTKVTAKFVNVCDNLPFLGHWVFGHG